MIDLDPLWGFALASTVIILAPGADVLLLLKITFQRGTTAGMWALVGIHLGNLLQATLMVSGVSLLLAGLPHALDILKLVGAAYLLYLAWGSARAARDAWTKRGMTPAELPQPVTRGGASAVLSGLLTNVTNPKVLIFFVAFFPQFLGGAGSQPLQLLLLSAVFIVLAVVWEGLIVLGAARLAPVVRAPRFAFVTDASCAVVFVALAAVLVSFRG